MQITNHQMYEYILGLSTFLERRDKIGYAAARNTRILKDSCIEYLNRREELIFEYGDPEIDDNGAPTGRKYIVIGTKSFDKFSEELESYANIEHDVKDIFKLKYDDVIGILSGEEILSMDWMLED